MEYGYDFKQLSLSDFIMIKEYMTEYCFKDKVLLGKLMANRSKL